MNDRTSIIISNLTKSDFVAAQGKSLSLAAQIKLGVLNLPDQPDFSNLVVQWSELPFLSRIVAIFKTPEAASLAYGFLEKSYNGTPLFTLPPTAKLSLQENLLQRSRLANSLSDIDPVPVPQNKDAYHEPEPQPFDADKDLPRLGIDVAELNDSAPPIRDLRRSSSVMKTLFAPPLRLDTNLASSDESPRSPTITLEETP